MDPALEELRYLFKHALLRDAAYDMQLQARLRQLHRRAAEAILLVYGQQALALRYADLAYHYDRAGDQAQAAHWYQQAGEQAAAQYANAAAVAYFGRALDLIPDADTIQRYALLLARERVYDLQGAREAQAQDLAELENLAQTLADGRRLAEVKLRQAHLAEVTNDLPAAAAKAQAAVDLAREAQSTAQEAAAFLQWGRAFRFQEDFAAAQGRLEQALALAEAAGLRQVEADGLVNLGAVFWKLSEFASARTVLDRAWVICRDLGDQRREGWACNNLGLVIENLGEYRAAIGYYEQALRLFRHVGDRWAESMALGNLGYIHLMRLGDFSRAGEWLLQDIDICRQIQDRRGEAWSLGFLGLLAHQVGDDEQAVAHARLALSAASEAGDPRVRADTLITLGHALAGLRRTAEATAAYEEAVVLQRELGRDHLAMEALAGLAHLFLAAGDLNRARAQVEEILAFMETGSLDRIAEPFRMYLTCYRVLQAGQDARALEILALAHTTLQAQAARIDDEELRRAFLEDVPSHRALVRVVREQGAEEK